MALPLSSLHVSLNEKAWPCITEKHIMMRDTVTKEPLAGGNGGADCEWGFLMNLAAPL